MGARGGTQGRDLEAGPRGGAQWCDPGMGPRGMTKEWEPGAGPRGRTQGCDPGLERQRREPGANPRLHQGTGPAEAELSSRSLQQKLAQKYSICPKDASLAQLESPLTSKCPCPPRCPAFTLHLLTPTNLPMPVPHLSSPAPASQALPPHATLPTSPNPRMHCPHPTLLCTASPHLTMPRPLTPPCPSPPHPPPPPPHPTMPRLTDHLAPLLPPPRSQPLPSPPPCALTCAQTHIRYLTRSGCS